MLVLFNPGSVAEFKIDPCPQAMPQLFERWLSQHTKNFKKSILCSQVGAGEFLHRRRTGEAKIDKRIAELIAHLEALIASGWTAKNIILVGQSAGAWLSLSVLAQRPDLASGAIVFAPEFAGRKQYRSKGWYWLRKQHQQKIAQAKSINALVFAFAGDEYYQLQDLDFLTQVKGIELVQVGAQQLENCQNYPPHRLVFNQCFASHWQQGIYQKLLLLQKNAAP